MAIQILYDFEVESSEPFLPKDIPSRTARVLSVSEAPAFATETDCLQESTAEDGSYLKCILVAIGLEGAMALGFYGLWQLWHHLR